MPEITIPPGVVKTLSEATAVGRFIQMDHVRFYNGKAQKIGGWTKLNPFEPLQGVPRSLYAYAKSNRQEVKIAGTETRLYAMDLSHSISDITPYRKVTPHDPAVTLSTPGTGVEVTVFDAVHGAEAGDVVHITPTHSLGTITFTAGDYVVDSVVNANEFIVLADDESSIPAVVGDIFTISYYIEPGSADSSITHGYGAGPYGELLYGIDNVGAGDPHAEKVPPRYWSLDNYGTSGLFTFQDAPGVFLWDGNVNVKPAIIAGSEPALNEDIIYAFVTPERFIFVLCEGMVLKWPDRDDITDWVPTSTNTANERRLASGSHFIAGTRLASVSLIWTDTSVYLAQYIGGNSIYNTQLIGTNCGLVGPGAFCHETGTAFWFGCNSFHMFAGQIGPIPNQDNVLAWMISRLDPLNAVKMTCFFNPAFREVWWLFPERDHNEPNLYVAVNLDNFEWIHGSLDRCGATQQAQQSRRPILSSPDGFLYEHDQEQRNAVEDTIANVDGTYTPVEFPIDWHYQVGLWRIPSDKKQSVDIFGFAPDFEYQTNPISLVVRAYDRPQSALFDQETAVLSNNATELVDLRVAGRYFSYHMSQMGEDNSLLGGDFRDGTHWLEVQGAGLRR
jgi:hypothetical protein